MKGGSETCGNLGERFHTDKQQLQAPWSENRLDKVEEQKEDWGSWS